MSEHRMTEQSDGSVQCSCGVTSQRFGTRANLKQWMSQHRRETKR